MQSSENAICLWRDTLALSIREAALCGFFVAMTPVRQYETLAELRAWELALRVIARVQDESRFWHFWHAWL